MTKNKAFFFEKKFVRTVAFFVLILEFSIS